MKHYFLIFVSVFALCTTCHAESSLSLVSKISHVEMHDEPGLDIDQNIGKKYQAAAKFLSSAASYHSNYQTVDTSIITYETTYLGVNCHIAWYVDGYIGTSLDGTEQGKQVVFVNGSVVGISYDIDIYSDHFEHKYTWGKVYSYPHRQVVKFY